LRNGGPRKRRRGGLKVVVADLYWEITRTREETKKEISLEGKEERGKGSLEKAGAIVILPGLYSHQ